MRLSRNRHAGRRPGIHACLSRHTIRRGYRSFARHDGWTRGAAVAALIGHALLSARTAPAQQPVDWSKAQTINLLLVDDKFVPQQLTLRHGVPYLIHMENHGGHLHEFTAPAFFADAILRDPHVLAAEGKEVVVQPARTADLYLMPVKPGSYPLICADHDWAGMVGQILVE